MWSVLEVGGVVYFSIWSDWNCKRFVGCIQLFSDYFCTQSMNFFERRLKTRRRAIGRLRATVMETQSHSAVRFECPPCGSTMTCLCARCASLPFSFLPKSRPMEDLMPFFFGCLWRESWLLATLLSALASASREATILTTQTHKENIKKFQTHFNFTNQSLTRQCVLDCH